MKYVLIDGEDREHCPRLSFAKLRAGERLIAGDGPVFLEDEAGRRWSARLADDFDVILTPVYSDGVQSRVPADLEAGRTRRYVELIDREERRRKRIKGEREQRDAEARRERHTVKKHRRPVVCVEERRPFESVSAAARWIGLSSPNVLTNAIKRGTRCGRLTWQYADVLLKEVEDAPDVHAAAGDGDGKANGHPVRAIDPALRAAAQRAMLLWERPEVQEVPRPGGTEPDAAVCRPPAVGGV